MSDFNTGQSNTEQNNIGKDIGNQDIPVFDPEDIEKNKAMAGLAYLIFFLPLVAAPESKFGRFHANQGLLLLIVGVAGGIVVMILSAILTYISYILGATIGTLLSFAFWIGYLVLGVMGLINGFGGHAKELPVIGKFRIIK